MQWNNIQRARKSSLRESTLFFGWVPINRDLTDHVDACANLTFPGPDWRAQKMNQYEAIKCENVTTIEVNWTGWGHARLPPTKITLTAIPSAQKPLLCQIYFGLDLIAALGAWILVIDEAPCAPIDVKAADVAVVSFDHGCDQARLPPALRVPVNPLASRQLSVFGNSAEALALLDFGNSTPTQVSVLVPFATMMTTWAGCDVATLVLDGLFDRGVDIFVVHLRRPWHDGVFGDIILVDWSGPTRDDQQQRKQTDQPTRQHGDVVVDIVVLGNGSNLL